MDRGRPPGTSDPPGAFSSSSSGSTLHSRSKMNKVRWSDNLTADFSSTSTDEVFEVAVPSNEGVVEPFARSFADLESSRPSWSAETIGPTAGAAIPAPSGLQTTAGAATAHRTDPEQRMDISNAALREAGFHVVEFENLGDEEIPKVEIYQPRPPHEPSHRCEVLSRSHRRPMGRAPRRPCNTRTGGSRRVTRAGPSSSDDPHQPDPGDGDPEQNLLAAGRRR